MTASPSRQIQTTKMSAAQIMREFMSSDDFLALVTNVMSPRRLIRSPRRRGRGQVLSNLRQEPARADGLSHVGIATRRTRLVLSLIQFISCDGNDRYSL